jgi:putative PIG3 family NAD(P)H quinone oxidoreductase
MRVITIREPGGPEILELAARPDPEVGRREIRVAVAASGVNRADLLQRVGGYPVPAGAPVDIPGLEFAGTVESVGRDTRRWDVGDRVMGLVAGGGYADRVVVHEDEAVAVPPSIDLVDAAGIPEAFLTAFDALDLQCGIRAGEAVLIHAVGSGVGTAALQIARRAGLRTIGTSRTPAKLERAAELGLGVPLHAGPGLDWVEGARAATAGRGVDVILDLVGAAYVEENQRVIATRGRWIVVGVPSGRSATIDLRALMSKRVSVTGTVLRARPQDEKIALARAAESRLVPGFADGSLRPVIDRRYPAAEAAEAHARMEANENFGAIVLTWD